LAAVREARVNFFARLRAINEAFFGVLRAEIDALAADLGAAGKRYASGALLLAVTLAIGAVLLAVLVFVSIAVLALWLPWWGAGLVVAGVLALAGLICGGVAMRRLRGETPPAIVRRHVNDHLDWWQRRVASDEGRAPVRKRPGLEEEHDLGGEDLDAEDLDEDIP
jgi:hypothetical protein